MLAYPLSACGIKSRPPGHSFETARYDHLQLIVVLGGEVFFSHEKETISAKRGQVILLHPQTSFRLTCKKDPYDGVFASVVADKKVPRLPSACFAASGQLMRLACEVRQELGAGEDESFVQTFFQLMMQLAIRAQQEVQNKDSLLIEGEIWTQRVQ